MPEVLRITFRPEKLIYSFSSMVNVHVNGGQGEGTRSCILFILSAFLGLSLKEKVALVKEVQLLEMLFYFSQLADKYNVIP